MRIIGITETYTHKVIKMMYPVSNICVRKNREFPNVYAIYNKKHNTLQIHR
jgi:hypothetical protein